MANTASPLDAALPPAVRLHEARERLVLLMVNEAALVLSKGVVADAATLDVAMVFGSGGGPIAAALCTTPTNAASAKSWQHWRI